MKSPANSKSDVAGLIILLCLIGASLYLIFGYGGAGTSGTGSVTAPPPPPDDTEPPPDDIDGAPPAPMDGIGNQLITLLNQADEPIDPNMSTAYQAIQTIAVELVKKILERLLDRKAKASEEKVRSDASKKRKPRVAPNAEADVGRKTKAAEEKVRSDASNKRKAGVAPNADVDADGKTRAAEEKVRSDASNKRKAGVAPNADVDADGKARAAEEKVRSNASNKRKAGVTPGVDAEAGKKARAAEEKVRSNASNKRKAGVTPGVDAEAGKKARAAEEKVRSTASNKRKAGVTPGVDAEARKKARAAEEKVRSNASNKRKGGVTPGVDVAARKKASMGLDRIKTNVFERMRNVVNQAFPQFERTPLQSAQIKRICDGRTPVDSNGRLLAGETALNKPVDQHLRRSVFGHVTDPNSVRGNTMVLASRLKALPNAIGRTLKIAGQGALAAVNILDRLDIPLMTVDAFLKEKFPNESDLLSPAMVRDVNWQTVKAQIDYITEYNTTVVDVFNANSANIRDPIFPLERAQFPMIMGPLDKLEPDGELARYVGAEYRNLRAKILVYSAAESLLRTSGNYHRTQLYDNVSPSFWSGTSAGWYQFMSFREKNSEVSLVDLFFSGTGGKKVFTNSQRDNLYRDAFTLVCNSYGGIVYEDLHICDDTSWNGRPRFQCGYATQSQCSAHAQDWIANDGITGGDYAEWYNFSELNTLLTQMPSASKNISACTSTGTSYSTACNITANRFVAGQTAACVTTSPYMASICDSFKGTYDYNTHMCTYTMAYCQSMGMCYDQRNQVCQLPHDTMFALSMFFGGDGVTREFIKINGCGFNGNAFNPTQIFNASGRYLHDMFTDKDGIREGLKSTFSPTSTQGAMGFTMMAGAVVEFGLTAVQALTLIEVSARVNMAVTVITLGVIGGLIVATVIENNQIQNQMPPDTGDYPKEYAITGLTTDGTEAKTCGLAEGWRTKPILAHVVQDPPPAANATPASVIRTAPGNIQGMPGYTHIDFFSRTTELQSSINFHNQNMGLAIDAYTGLKTGRTKNYCSDVGKLRAGSNGAQNDAFCIDYFPPTTYADVNNIGQLAPVTVQTVDGQSPGTESYVVNRAWTDGSAMDIPQYPSKSNRQGAEWGNRPELWYYQLVYDRDNMVMDTPTGMPKRIWDLNYLSLHFTERTIQDMRIYYCRKALEKDANDHKVAIDAGTYILGTNIDDRCWGYVKINIPNKYKYYRMTIPLGLT